MRICHMCGNECEDREYCNPCSAGFANRRDAATMTGQEREAELALYKGPLEIPSRMVHQRIAELVGRPVWTHELGCDWASLMAEARGDRPSATMEEVLRKIPSEKRVVVIEHESSDRSSPPPCFERNDEHG